MLSNEQIFQKPPNNWGILDLNISLPTRVTWPKRGQLGSAPIYSIKVFYGASSVWRRQRQVQIPREDVFAPSFAATAASTDAFVSEASSVVVQISRGRDVPSCIYTKLLTSWISNIMIISSIIMVIILKAFTFDLANIFEREYSTSCCCYWDLFNIYVVEHLVTFWYLARIRNFLIFCVCGHPLIVIFSLLGHSNHYDSILQVISYSHHRQP